jgi:hypothetical protein
MDSVTPYIGITDAQAYFDDARLNAESWDNSTSDLQLKALKSATTMINRLNFKGSKAVSSQPNEFPRQYNRQNLSETPVTIPTTTPVDIQIACCELALSLLDGVDPDLEEDSLGAITEAYATARMTSDPSVRKDHIRAGIPSVLAWKHLLPYLNDPMDLHLRRG